MATQKSRPTARFVPVADIAAGAADFPPWDTVRYALERAELDAALDDADVDPGLRDRRF